MSTTTLPSRTAGGAAPSSRPAPAVRSAARAFLHRFAVTLLPILAVPAALLLAAPFLLDAAGTWGGGWPVSVAVVAGWSFAVAGWLHRRGWPIGTPVAVNAVLVALLAVTAAAGWLSASGLLLWGPVGTALAAALGMAARPLVSGPENGRGPGRSPDQGLAVWGE